METANEPKTNNPALIDATDIQRQTSLTDPGQGWLQAGPMPGAEQTTTSMFTPTVGEGQ